MAISPILEQKDSRLIVKILLEGNKTVKEINEYLLNNKILDISTATLYRRVKELFLSGYLDKLDDGSYSTSKKGRIAYNELFNQKMLVNEQEKNLYEIVRQLSGKESHILQKLHNKPSYTSGLLNEIAISPNDLLKIFENLIHLQLIEIVEKPGKTSGRPKKVYRLTDSGKKILREIEELKLKLQRFD